MHRIVRSTLLVAGLLLASIHGAWAQDDQVIIQVHETPQTYVLGVPVSKLEMTIPKGALKAQALKGAPDNPRYFLFEDAKTVTIISGWFESADGFKGIKAFWEQETASWKQHGLPDAIDVSFEKIGNWDAIIYDTKIAAATNTHIRAHWVQAGTWIDIHLSVTSLKPSSENRQYLKSLLQGIKVAEKK